MRHLNGTETQQHLMQAFAAKTQASSRLAMYAAEAKKEGYSLIQQLFETVSQRELVHGNVFYDCLAKNGSEETYELNGTYPIDLHLSRTVENLRAAVKHFDQEIYFSYGKTALAEGFSQLAERFMSIASIESEHQRKFADVLHQLETKTLFKKSEPAPWECQCCGHLHYGVAAPAICPVCEHGKGYFEAVQLPEAALEQLKASAKALYMEEMSKGEAA